VALAGLLSVVNLWGSTDVGVYGGRIYPVTRVTIGALNGIFSAMTVIMRSTTARRTGLAERERKTHEIVDATAAPDGRHSRPRRWPSPAS